MNSSAILQYCHPVLLNIDPMLEVFVPWHKVIISQSAQDAMNNHKGK